MSQSNASLDEKLQQIVGQVKQQGVGVDWLREVVEWIVQELLELEFTEHVGALPYERTASRQGYRNGCRERQLHTRVGTLTLRVPRDREGRFSTALFEQCQRSEKALILALQEAYLQGVSTRKMTKLTEKLCGTRFSKDQVSRMAQALDGELDRWRNRPLKKRYPYLVVDGRYEHVREDGHIESEGVLTVEGIREDGHRDILSVDVAPGEDETSWGEMFCGLLDRGLDAEAVVYVVSDEHRGLCEALRRYFPHAVWQRCQTHYQRNAAKKVTRRARGEVHGQLRDVFEAPSLKEAKARAERLIEDWQDRSPEFVEWLEETIEDCLAVFTLPEGHRRRLRSTNGLERFHQELKRRSRAVRIFPNRRSCLRLVSALAMEQSEEWLTSHRYLTMAQQEQEEVQQEAQEASLQPVTA